MKEISKKIGERVKQAREEKGLTQRELAEYLGYSTMGISYFEQGEREMKISDIHRLASYFGKDISFFLSSGVTLFRGNTDDANDNETSKSLSDFDTFLASRKKK